MAVYIVTNRRVDQNNQISIDGREKAQSCFRIAKFHEYQKGISDQQIHECYSLLGDYGLRGYRKLLDTPADQREGTQALFGNLYEDMVGKSGDVMFFIHGFQNDLHDEFEGIERLKEQYLHSAEHPQRKVKHLVYLSWPSQSDLKYERDQEDARDTGVMLGRLFRNLRMFFADMFEKDCLEPCRNNIHLVAHSMGNQVLDHMLKSLETDDLKPLFTESILFNPDVDHDVFTDEGGMRRLTSIADRVHVYMHRSDEALLVSRYTKNGKRRLGRSGPAYPKNLPDFVYVVDITNTKSVGGVNNMFDHWGYTECPEVVQDATAVLKGEGTFSIPSRQQHESVNPWKFILP
ncbi:alpha/beta hydrolase [Parendozoicomonas sp. Alg238-R29]|uniref:alpha/beta hydrolase n=1 Tax=Parendozoicomonas sp. Alg238-R29 TaxID=2993446 RepID=UPI00248D49AF|nr:alpha/beta hydrolase [Parendozoicomonas sp. Alg238-R29]